MELRWSPKSDENTVALGATVVYFYNPEKQRPSADR